MPIPSAGRKKQWSKIGLAMDGLEALTSIFTATSSRLSHQPVRRIFRALLEGP